MKTLSFWHDVELPFGLTLRLKAMTKAEAYEFFQALGKLSDVKVERLEDNAGLIDETWGRAVFSRFVRLPEAVEIEGKTVTTGEELFGELPLPLLMQVLFELRTLATVAPSLGKGSGSPSTSVSASGTPATSSSGSAAPSTAGAASPDSSTVTASSASGPSGAQP